MEFNILELLLGQIPEAVYFSLFMIFTKQLKEKRLLFTIIMILEYVLIQRVIHFNIWLHIIYTIFVYLILKLLYKDKAQVTDIFTFTISSILLILIDIPLYFGIAMITDKYIIFVIIERIAMFTTLFLLKNKLPKIQSLYKKCGIETIKKRRK